MLEHVLQAFEDGRLRIIVEAVPGAGKTHLLRAVAASMPTLVLAYNALLAEDVSREIADYESARCFTYHALCCRHIASARDDCDLEEVVRAVECGQRVVISYPQYEQLFIDEAQDVRPLYIRLLRVLNLLSPGTRIIVAGDRRQLVYDFDEEFPASLDVLCDPPNSVHPGPWVRIVSNRTRRLTRPMCAIVNGIFGSSIYTTDDGPPVEIRCPRTAFAIHEAIGDIDEPYLLLYDRRRGNAPLRHLVNALCTKRNVSVHGMDLVGPSDDGTDIRAATYWSAKGLQSSTVVVLLPGSAPRNPLYVAMTRATRRLVLVLDPKDPHAGVCTYAANATSACVRVVGAMAQRCIEAGRHRNTDASLMQRVFPNAPRDVVCLDTASPRLSVVRTATTLVDDRDNDGDGGIGCPVATQMAIVWLEYKQTAHCRAMEGILQPCRMEASLRDAAIVDGFVGRSVSPYMTNILSDDLLCRSRTAYAALRHDEDVSTSWSNLCTVACATLTWDAFEHVMRQTTSPPSPAEYAAILEWACDVVDGDSTFDTRLIFRRDASHYHVRVHASCAACSYHVVWSMSSSVWSAAAIRALLHPTLRCRVLLLATMSTVDVTVHDTEALWSAM